VVGFAAADAAAPCLSLQLLVSPGYRLLDVLALAVSGATAATLPAVQVNL